ncbi:TPA: hypothetical protein VC360_001414 [Streptococcus pyogenes]|uniref:hypothetical protein n=1 Tax=Streptococcus gordonii TaxID=1302 RepID=UPI002283BDA2|nr:hypothetical protein [Streptococcus gordonii]MCY7130092.1 hypothetical protein [Streptococcus gordonii]MCY7141848.1 hypothetical protein [Streptococcus gordonii]HEP5937567.1 hypothetical protein [Streptococcus pyogenes]HEQ4682274.1 hypothetical protein [Streptococcus pyogenes]
MAKYKATSNVVFLIDGKEQNYDKDVEYDMDVKSADELNAKGELSHPELSPFFERVDKEEKAAKADK